jgi:lipopolysaccharide export system permease protein
LFKKLNILIASRFFKSFAPTFIVVLFIMLMQFIWLYIDDLAGKGLDTWIIAQLMFYVSAGIIPLALPLSILLASIMTFGALGESYELIAAKSAGVSIWRIFTPLYIVMAFLSVFAFFVSNTVIPKAILKQKALLYDINQQKPAMMIKEKVFYNGIDGISMRIGKKNNSTNELEDVLIYDKRNSYGTPVVVYAKRGNLVMSEDNRYLFFNLYDGVRYEEMDKQAGYERTRPHSKLYFEEQQIMFDMYGFRLTRSDESLFKDGYQMLNIKEISAKVDTLKITREQKYHTIAEYFNMYLKFNDSNVIRSKSIAAMIPEDSLFKWYDTDAGNNVATALNNVRVIKSTLDFTTSEIQGLDKSISRYTMEWHKKFTLSVACIVMFFIGAPFGTIIRKGGFGMPLVVSVLFYLVFHIVSIVGEKMVKTGSTDPFTGMWMAIMVLTPIGVFLTYQAANDSGLFDLSSWKKLLQKFNPVSTK